MQARHALATAVRFDRRRKKLILTLDSGIELAFAPHLAQGLQDASADDLAAVQISPSGLGLHFPTLDADLYVPALLNGLLGSSRWIAAQNGRSKKDVEKALRYVESQGWRIVQGGSHAWGKMYCPVNSAECRCGEFCITSIWSTPKSAKNHAAGPRRVVDNCVANKD